jgi:hypothetical protein
METYVADRILPVACHLTVAELRPWGLRRFWSAEAGIFLCVWLALVCCGRTELFRDPGVFWHTAAGQRMLDRGEIVRSDPFSFVVPGKHWVEYEWLADCGMALLYRASGWDGLLLVTATLLAAVYAGIAARLLRAGLQLLPTMLVVGLALAASSQNFHARPLVITLALQAWLFARLVDVEAGRRPLRSLAWVVPVLVLWQNCHGGVLAGFGTLGLVLLGWCASKLWDAGGGRSGELQECHASEPARGPTGRWRDVAVLGAILAASALGLLLNPYGLDMPRSWAKILALPLGQLIQEHAPLDPRQPYGMLAVLLGVGYLVALAGVWPRRFRITWLMPLVWFVLAGQRVRNAPLAAVVTVIALADLLPHTRWAQWLAAHDMFQRRVTRGPRRSASEFFSRVTLPAMAVLLAVAVQLCGLRLPLIGQGWVQLDPARWPVALLPELHAIEGPAGMQQRRIYNDMLFGGFLIFHVPRLQVFIDDRCEHYGRDFLLAYDRLRREDPAQLDVLRRQYHFDFALVASGSPVDRYLDGDHRWRLVRRSGPAALWRATD